MTKHENEQVDQRQLTQISRFVPQLRRTAVISTSTDVLTDIYQEDVNIAVWQQQLSDDMILSAQQLVTQFPHLKVVMTVAPADTYKQLAEHLGLFANNHEICLKISLLVDMFCTLFDLKRVGLRLTALETAMCPKFHVDKVPCRLVTTFTGSATQWLNNNIIDRSKLGAGSLGISDEQSGLYRASSHINQLSVGDVALLKGDGWFHNEGGGLVHRSPSLKTGEKRLLLTLDFSD
ncbi:DUF1826 domain-containing protein [Shewanella sp. Scap07]|uniref:DUF1826 domain-containing protein n=1 Tax=Shewanella sp. Scap07 TaxID=2589987 RepID=UPI0015C1C028|nr:DUF1826 domain-containing protein [Shewanella sp. Scap07]QLE83928.1 DUF1826 domain-containing protein [Shewanella sp. Scap07]